MRSRRILSLYPAARRLRDVRPPLWPLAAATPAAAPAAPAQTIPAPADVAAPPADAQTTASGLASKVLTAGTGTDHPVPTDLVKVHYTGWTTDGKMFDSSVARGRPAVLPLGRVIAGWARGAAADGGGGEAAALDPRQARLRGRSPTSPQGMLVFDVELLDILRVPPVPPDVAAPARRRRRSPRPGLAWKVLKPGTGTLHPKPASVVKVHYTGWTTDGKMFDSSYSRGTPSTFELDQGHPRLDRGPAAHDRGRVPPLLDPQEPRLPRRPRQAARVCWCSTWIWWRSRSRRHGLFRPQSPARRPIPRTGSGRGAPWRGGSCRRTGSRCWWGGRRRTTTC